jgi:hypothetical protein
MFAARRARVDIAYRPACPPAAPLLKCESSAACHHLHIRSCDPQLVVRVLYVALEQTREDAQGRDSVARHRATTPAVVLSSSAAIAAGTRADRQSVKFKSPVVHGAQVQSLHRVPGLLPLAVGVCCQARHTCPYRNIGLVYTIYLLRKSHRSLNRQFLCHSNAFRHHCLLTFYRLTNGHVAIDA